MSVTDDWPGLLSNDHLTADRSTNCVFHTVGHIGSVAEKYPQFDANAQSGNKAWPAAFSGPTVSVVATQ